MTDVFQIQLPDGRVVGVQANSPEEAAQGARNIIAREKGSVAQDITNVDRSAFARGLSFGSADEIGAAFRATVGPAIRSGMEFVGAGSSPDFQNSPVGQASQAPSWSQRYEEELAKARGQAKADKEAHPARTTAGEVAGNIVGTGALAAVPGVGAVLRGSPGVVANVAKGAVGGAVLGGGQTFAEGEGGFDQRLKEVPKGAMVGGAVGGAIPVAGAGVQALVERFGPSILNAIGRGADKVAPKVVPESLSAAAPDGGPITKDSLAATIADSSRAGASKIEQDAAIKRLALEISRSGGVGKAGTKLDELGEGAFIADTSKGATRLANLGNILPGEAGDKYASAFGQRNRETGQRFLTAMGDEAKVLPVADAQRALDENLKAVGTRVYGAMDEAGLKQTPELMEIYQNPHVAAAIDRVMATEKGTRIGTGRAPASPVEIMHKVKQAIWDLGFDKDTARPGPMSSWYRDLGIEYMNRLKRANPALADADKAYAEAASLPDWLARGQGFMRQGTSDAATEVSPAALAADLPKATPAQLQALRTGSSNTMRDTAMGGPDATRRLAKAIADNEIMQQKLTEIYGPEVAQRLIQRSNAEREFAKTGQAVTAGSQTAERGAALADEVALSIPTGGANPVTFLQAALNKYQQIRQPNESVRSRLADLLANPDAATNKETLQLVKAILEQQRRARPFAAGAGAASGGAVGGP